MTLPFGAKTRPLNPAVPTYRFEPVRVDGLYWITLEEPGEAAMIFPLGKRSEPDCMAARKPEVMAEPAVVKVGAFTPTVQKTPS